jgi:hypothetical protein
VVMASLLLKRDLHCTDSSELRISWARTQSKVSSDRDGTDAPEFIGP